MLKSKNCRRVSFIAAITLLVAIPTTALPASPQDLFERAETLYRQLEVVDPSGQDPSWTRVADAFADVAVRYPDSPLASQALWRVSWIYGRRARSGGGAHRCTLPSVEVCVRVVAPQTRSSSSCGAPLLPACG